MKMQNGYIVIERGDLLLPSLKDAGFSLDQRLMRCLEVVASYSLDDNHIVQGLIELNSSIVGKFNLELPDKSDGSINWFPYYGAPRTSIWGARPEGGDRELWSEAASIAKDRDSTIIGTRDFLLAVANHLDTGRTKQGYAITTLDLLKWALKNSHHTVADVIKYLTEVGPGDENIQYVLTFDSNENRLLFRAVSFLEDIIVESTSGELQAQRALLTHYSDAFGIVFDHEISELEELLNSNKSKELDFQRFFEDHPNFFGFWDYKEIHPQVYLQRKNEGTLIADFILTDVELQKAMILELKRPTSKIIKNQKNRERFSSAVYEARSQLLTYREFFRSTENRELLQAHLKMKVYEPRLAVIIGRSSDFQSGLQKQIIQSQNSDIELLTYDDILAHARRRRALISPTIR